MFSLFNKSSQISKGETAIFVIDGMHCTSCSLHIDMSLEELPGVVESSTHFAKGKTTVTYNPEQISIKQLEAKIKETGYNAVCEKS
jgi:copper chaperone CopZ